MSVPTLLDLAKLDAAIDLAHRDPAAGEAALRRMLRRTGVAIRASTVARPGSMRTSRALPDDVPRGRKSEDNQSGGTTASPSGSNAGSGRHDGVHSPDQ